MFFGQDSEEHLRISNEKKRQEVFEKLKSAIPNTSYRLEAYTAWKAARKAIVATSVIILLFAIVLDTAIRIEEGTYYGMQLVIVLFFAGLGVRNVILLFGSLIAIGVIAIVRKMRNPPVKHIISR